METLDVGCGDKPKGTVNLDLNIGETSHIHRRNCTISPKHIKNFIKADAHHLPFRLGAFQKVFCHHTLEHLGDPSLAISELLRVSTGKVEVVVPFRWSEKIHNFFWIERRRWAEKHHINFFNVVQLVGLFSGVNAKVCFRYKLFQVLRDFKRFRGSLWRLLTLGVLGSFIPPIPNELIVVVNQ